MSKECKFSLAIRLRPLNQREEESQTHAQWKIDLNHELERKLFTFPHNNCKKVYAEMLNSLYYTSFDETQTNDAVYHEFIFDKVVEAMTQFSNHTFIAYGSIGSGKTHTMLGTANDSGIISKAAEQIFANLNGSDVVKTEIRVSCFEIYNDNIIDLLNPRNESLKLGQDTVMMMVHTLNCTDEVVTNSADFMKVIRQANQNRQTDEINFNEENSRSHVIIRIFVECRNLTNNDGPIRYFELNFVDLAGHSYLFGQKNANEKQKNEDFHINASLGSLRNIAAQLNQLSEFHIPVTFQESHLTKLLQLCFMKNTSTALLLTMSPAEISETCMTLQFASCFKYLQLFTVYRHEDWNMVHSLQTLKNVYLENFQRRHEACRLFLTHCKEKIDSIKWIHLQMQTVLNGFNELDQLLPLVDTAAETDPEAATKALKTLEKYFGKMNFDEVMDKVNIFLDGTDLLKLSINKVLSL